MKDDVFPTLLFMPLPTNLTTLDGTPLTPAELENQVILFINVASQCGLTPQYSGLVELDKKYSDRGFKVIGVPCSKLCGKKTTDR